MPGNGKNPLVNEQDPPPSPRKGKNSDKKMVERDGAIVFKNGGVGSSKNTKLQEATINSHQEHTEGPYTCSSRLASQSRMKTFDNQELVDIIENQNRAIKRLEQQIQRLNKPTPGT